MTPEEFLQIINELPPDQRAAYEHDLMLYGHGYVRMTEDGRYERIAPRNSLISDKPNNTLRQTANAQQKKEKF